MSLVFTTASKLKPKSTVFTTAAPTVAAATLWAVMVFSAKPPTEKVLVV